MDDLVHEVVPVRGHRIFVGNPGGARAGRVVLLPQTRVGVVDGRDLQRTELAAGGEDVGGVIDVEADRHGR